MARTLTMTFFILTLFSLPSQGQTDFRVMSYNVENLFDTKDDPLTADNDFLPSGNRPLHLPIHAGYYGCVYAACG